MVLAVIGVALVAAIVTFLVLLVVRPPSRKVVTAPTTTNPMAPPTTFDPNTDQPAAPFITPARLKELTDDLVPFVEKKRMLKFTTPPAPVFDDDASFTKAWKAHLVRSDPIFEHLDVPLKALGLNPNALDLVKAREAFYGDKVVVFYDNSTKELHVRSTPDTPYLSAALVAALTEQLDDQHFTTGRIDPTKGLGDEYLGLASLTSGDGIRISDMWVLNQSMTAQQEVQAENQYRSGDSMNFDVIPPALTVWLAVEQSLGLPLTTTLVTSTTSSPLDAAFAKPPGGSAQVINPGWYVDGVTQMPVALPKADGPIVASGTLGDVFLRQALGLVSGADAATATMQSYRGDSLVGWKSGDKSCIRINVTTGDKPIEPMTAALQTFADAMNGSVTSVADPARPGKTLAELTVCGDPNNSESPGTTIPTPGRPGPSVSVPGSGGPPI